ncbi:asparaginase [Nakamurella flava]|uniref:Asparaginase n=1 Tax=Nakamurella flava TaxID=2576308 RepID=A0A4U6QNE6_9ACTN|nr:asparaginase [Nakamurella flava]TKV61596.1 asparaginase [Nakamurella flava]
MSATTDSSRAGAPTAGPGGPHSAGAPSGDVELVRVHRSGVHENSHYGALVILDADGTVLDQVGDVSRPVFHRSCAKPFQATAMLETGLTLDGGDLAVAAASHAGEAGHVERILGILAGGGLSEDDLGCPADRPEDESARDAAVLAGVPSRKLLMNCSGKHAAMLRTCLVKGWPTVGYLAVDHPLQIAVRATVTRLTGAEPSAVGVDGCGAPVFATDLVALARGFAALVTGPVGSPERRVADAMRAHPWLVGGTHSPDTQVMTAVPGILVKLGADGVQAFALPDGRAAAFKISDGAHRARLPLIKAALGRLGIDVDLPADVVLGGGRPVGAATVVPHLFS